MNEVLNFFAEAAARALADGAVYRNWGEAVRAAPSQGGSLRPYSLSERDWVQPASPVDVYWRKGDVRRQDATKYATRPFAVYTVSATLGAAFDLDACASALNVLAAVFGRFRRVRNAEINVSLVVADRWAAWSREFPGEFLAVEKNFVAVDFVWSGPVNEACLTAPCLPDCIEIEQKYDGILLD